MTRMLGPGLLLLALFAASLLAAPAVGPSPDTHGSLLARLYPGVPAWWVLARLACGLTGAALVAAALREPPFPPAASAAAPGAPGVALALVAAAALALVATGADRLGRPGQLAFFAALWLPALVLATAGREWRRLFLVSSGARGSALGVAAVLGLWAVLRVPGMAHEPRAASQVDSWVQIEWIEAAVAGGTNLLTASSLPGSAASYMFWLGVPLLPPGTPPAFAWVQGAVTLWLLAAGALVAALAGSLLGRRAAPVAAAAFLFSPFVLALPLSGMVLGLPPFYTARCLSLLLAVHRTRSPAALAALGALAGLAFGQAHTAPMALLCAAAAGWTCLRRPRLPGAALAVAALCAAAAALPSLPGPAELHELATLHVRRHGRKRKAEGRAASRRRAKSSARPKAAQRAAGERSQARKS